MEEIPLHAVPVQTPLREWCPSAVPASHLPSTISQQTFHPIERHVTSVNK